MEIESISDTEGIFLFLKGLLGPIKVTLANIYCPNVNQKKFIDRIMESILILGGDLNFILDPELQYMH